MEQKVKFFQFFSMNDASLQKDLYNNNVFYWGKIIFDESVEDNVAIRKNKRYHSEDIYRIFRFECEPQNHGYFVVDGAVVISPDTWEKTLKDYAIVVKEIDGPPHS